MAVLKTTSPVVLPFAPTETPRNTVPSSRASTAGVDTPVPRFALRRVGADAQSGSRSFRTPSRFLGWSPISFRARILTVPAMTVHLKSKNVAHAVQARGLPHQPFRRPQCAPRERDAVGGAMRDLDPLTGGRDRHGVLAHDIPGAQAQEADAAGNAQRALARPVENGDIVQRHAARPSDRFPERQRGTG